eukprot:TRINITY_DN18658_c0_g1_i1.p2 TRINITY_DN18658_c0_g1~~TRINITY_DN18658_c0_g1_i1.p2  ORF type:complete len:126 (+),score=17.86 TRINITY_DN18658_c0_g1_i1:1611-1988(+)
MPRIRFSLGGGRRGAHPQFSNFREDKENIPHSDDDEDGPILYRDDDNMEDEDRLAAKLARKESLSQNFSRDRETGADRQEHPVPGHGGGEEGRQKYHRSKAYTKAFSETNTRGVSRTEYSQNERR